MILHKYKFHIRIYAKVVSGCCMNGDFLGEKTQTRVKSFVIIMPAHQESNKQCCAYGMHLWVRTTPQRLS